MPSFARDIDIGYPRSLIEEHDEIIDDLDLSLSLEMESTRDIIEGMNEELRRLRVANELILGQEVGISNED